MSPRKNIDPNGKLSALLMILPFIISVSCQPTSKEQRTISIKALVGIQFDVVRFSVKPGAKVVLTLDNQSDMDHNLIITKPGSRMNVVNAALQLAGKGPETNFVPKTNETLWYIPLVSPGQSKSVSFTAPSVEGIYPYVCTYPGHGFVMYGYMSVSNKEALPDITGDTSIPESRRVDDKAEADKNVNAAKGHETHAAPNPLTPPYLYHTFIDGASPAAIAVNLPNDLSYCWDAGPCRLQMAWKGGFIDMSDVWKGHFDASAKVLGDIFYKDNTDFPFRMNESSSVPEVKYKGYRLVEKYPEFHYTINGADVYELIRPKPDGYGLIRDFRIPNAKSAIWFYANNSDESIEYDCSAGSFNKNKLKLSPAQSNKFTITMTSYHLAFKNKNG